jgi:hypothetical protein
LYILGEMEVEAEWVGRSFVEKNSFFLKIIERNNLRKVIGETPILNRHRSYSNLNSNTSSLVIVTNEDMALLSTHLGSV